MQCLFATLYTIHVRTCKCLYHTWEAGLCPPFTLHSIFLGGVASQGEVHSRGSDLHDCVWLTLDESHCQQGGEFWLTFLCTWEWVVWDWKLKIPPCDRGSIVCTHMVECCILWGNAFWVKWFSDSELLHALVLVVSSLCLFLEEPMFCFCMTVLSPESVFEGSCLVWSAALSSYPCLRGPIFRFGFV